MATKKKGKTTKKSTPKKSHQVSSSKAPYILIIMALAAGLLFLLSLQTDSLKHLVPKKNMAGQEERVGTANTSSKENKQEDIDKTKELEKEKSTKQELSPKKEKEKEKEVATVQVKVYFLYYNEKADKIELRPVVRTVNALIPVKAALEELIQGPSKLEEKKGYVSAIPSTLKVIDVSIVNKIAFINFNGALEEGAAGNIMLNRLDQIVYTATQFDNVEGIHILINGQRKRFLGPDGISIAGPLKRH